MTYSDLAAALRRTGIPFTEGRWKKPEELRTVDHGTYAIDDRHDLKGDTKVTERLLEGTVDLFAAGSNGLRQSRVIEDAMDAADIPWSVNLAGHYEELTGLTHWEWVFRCLP